MRPFCFTPYAVPVQAWATRYNRSLVRTRTLIEQSIGILKRRFHGLHVELRVDPTKCATIVVAAVVLHNIAMQRAEREEFDHQEDNLDCNGNLADDTAACQAARQMRDTFAQRFFT